MLERSAAAEDIGSAYRDYVSRLLTAETAGSLFAYAQREEFAEYVRLPRQRRIREGHEALFERIFARLKGEESLQARFGSCAIGDFTTTVKEGSAYGEWWDRELEGESGDRLVLFKSDDAVKSEDYLYTVIHETYPGHGHFYNSVRSGETATDHGAMMLIEGWATYSEWHSLPHPYVEAVRHNAMVFLHHALFGTREELAEVIWRNKRAQRIPMRKAVYALVNATQYIGYLESYYLGALWLEEMIDRRGRFTAEEFLAMLKTNSKGEFFRLWQ